ncbi:MAG TPA: hypothetical protein VH880_08130 [Anaeromyxobacteraceae bacterium]
MAADSPLAARVPVAAGGAEARAAAAALLRWRARGLVRRLPRRLAAGARLFPVLLHASFPQRALSGEPPGVAGMRYRRRWSTAARDFGLPPPSGMQRGRPLVEAVLAVPAPDGLDVLVLAASDLSLDDAGPVQERMERAQALLAAAGAPVRAGLYRPARIAGDAVAAQRSLAFGALLAGRLDGEAWPALEEGLRRPLEARELGALAASAPTPLAALFLTLLSRDAPPGALLALLSMLAEGATARQLADGDVFVARWAGRVPALRRTVEQALRLARRLPAGAGDVGAALSLARLLALRCTAAVRRARGRFDRVSKRFWLEAVGTGVPRALLPALGDRFRALELAGSLSLSPARVGRGYEVRLPGGQALGRGRDPVQARIRSLAIFAAARAAASGAAAADAGLAAADPTWRVVARHLARPPGRPALVLVVEAGGGARPGPPFDLLNRGAGRALEFEGAVAVHLAPGRRPSGRVLSADEAVETVVRRAPSAVPLELVASRPESRPVAARLAQIAALLRESAGEAEVAVEAGGRVWLRTRSGLRRYALDAFAARPRVFAPDPESPDLSLGRSRPGRWPPSALLQCRVTLARGGAAVLYADGTGGHLRELVPVEELEDHLREARAIVRAADPPSVLTLRLCDEVEQEVRRAGSVRREVSVAVGGALPAVEVRIGEEWFGGRSPLGWGAAAESLLAALPPGSEGGIGVNSVTAAAGGRPASPLLALWAASVARRRLRARVSRAALAYRPAASRRYGP